MMAKENSSKPKEQRRPPARYKSALGRARDEQKAQDKKKVAAMQLQEEDTASEDDFDNYSDVDGGERSRSFGITALRPFRMVTQGRPISQALTTTGPTGSINAVNSFSGLDGDAQDYDQSVIDSLNSWTAKVHIKSNKPKSQAQRKMDSKLSKTAAYIESNKRSDDAANDVVVVVQTQKRHPKHTNLSPHFLKTKKAWLRSTRKCLRSSSSLTRDWLWSTVAVSYMLSMPRKSYPATLLFRRPLRLVRKLVRQHVEVSSETWALSTLSLRQMVNKHLCTLII